MFGPRDSQYESYQSITQCLDASLGNEREENIESDHGLILFVLSTDYPPCLLTPPEEE